MGVGEDTPDYFHDEVDLCSICHVELSNGDLVQDQTLADTRSMPNVGCDGRLSLRSTPSSLAPIADIPTARPAPIPSRCASSFSAVALTGGP